ncbi:collagen-like protein [Aliifodinibius salicampi]|uniref:Collagen-like protein n=1 Tax=Fodinibius salicampi TaxID=1920655 RepID=A0ABT3Q021_9BACT|nr:hypothetical protein [Fodinibius salicampi]MCW9713436.1 collagen-like protein [Fodinibius salicampi]
MTLIVIIILPFFLGCEGPQGPNGSQGPQGPEGPVGPAGEDGSVMYSGQGGPSADIGDNGDYYLNQNTGELYGPKDSDGWGNPIIVLMGEDGQDGADGEDGTQIHAGSGAPDASVGVVGDFYIDTANQNLYGPKTDNGWGSAIDLNGEDGADGQDGADGEDGSQIYSGSGSPDASLGTTGDYYFDTANKDLYGPKTDSGWGTPTNLSGDDGQDGEDGSQIYAGTGTPDASLGVEGDYYLDKSSYELYGPKTNNGWGTPINLKGADGNANVTRYIFPAHDFSFDSSFNESINIDGDDVNESVWLAYMVSTNGWKYQITNGEAYGSVYKFYHATSSAIMVIDLKEGTGEVYDPIEIVRIESSETVDYRKQKGDSIIPDDLDTSDYEAVADYYNFYSE